MKVKIHGILGKIFGDSLEVKCSKLDLLLNAIDSIKRGFRKKIIELQKSGNNYAIVYDKEKKSVDVVPFIGGAGKWFGFILAAVLIVIGIVLMFFPGTQSIGIFLIKTGASLLLSSTIKMLMNRQQKFESQNLGVGGASMYSSSGGRSYIFSNKQNTATQGSLIAIGYGKLKVNSKIIGTSLKNYPSSFNFATLPFNNLNTAGLYD